MRQIMKVFQIGMKQIIKDGMLLVLLPAPLLVALLFRFGFPAINLILEKNLSFSLVQWYGIFDGILLCLTPLFMAIVSSFLILEERDEGIGIFYKITPIEGRTYLVARIGFPMIWAFLSTLLLGIFFHLSNLSFITILLSSILSTLMGVFFAMMIVSMANNRVEGLVLSKLTGIGFLGLLVVWFIPAPFQYLVAFLPSFWMGYLLLEGPNLMVFTGGLLSCFLLIGLFTRKFMKSIN